MSLLSQRLLGANVKARPITPRRESLRNPQPLHAIQLADALLRIQTVVQATGLSPATIYRKVAAKEFPEPVKLGSRCTRWNAASVRAWIQAQSLEVV